MLFAIAVSMQILQEDVHMLKTGLTALQQEMKKEPDNFIIFISYQPNDYVLLLYRVISNALSLCLSLTLTHS